MSQLITQKINRDRRTHIKGRPLGLALLVLYKGLWGIIECSAGIFAIFFSQFAAEELTEDPQDLFIQWVVSRIGTVEVKHIGIGILVLGLIKLFIAAGLWYRSHAIRNIAIAFLGLATIFALYELFIRITWFRLLTLCIDLAILYYFSKILPRHFKKE